MEPAATRGTAPPPRHTPVGNHGAVGGLATVAAVGVCGSIDFLCCSRFDSPTVCASPPDPERVGRFQIALLPDGVRARQLHLTDTRVLVTRSCPTKAWLNST